MDMKLLLHYEDYFLESIGIDVGDTNRNTIYNHSKYVTREQINSILDLLHNDYKRLSTNIHIYGNKFRLFANLSQFIGLLGITGKNTCGLQNGENIYVFCYNLKRWLEKSNESDKHIIKDCTKLTTISTMFHELRHVYQMYYKYDKYMNDTLNYIGVIGKGYGSQWVERDANKFAQRMMNKYNKEINNILGINFEWYMNYDTSIVIYEKVKK